MTVKARRLPRPMGMTAEETFRHFMLGEPPASECWLWTGPTNDYGYGLITCVKGATVTHTRAHRMSYQLFVGPIPDGKLIRHTCDNPPCVQPTHLLPGTQHDNSQDAVKRGRLVGNIKVKGSASNLAVLTETDVLDIRAAHAAGQTVRELAEHYRLTYQAIWMIVRRVNWKHI